MGIFGFRKKENVLDLTKQPAQNPAKSEESSEYVQVSSAEFSRAEPPAVPTAFGFFGSSSKSATPTSAETNEPDTKRKLAKRLIDMTTKLEDISNQIYHLQQRIEVLERKNDVNRFG